MKHLSLLSALLLASSCLQPVSEDGGVRSDEIALDDYCDALEEYRTCINPRQCGVAATDVSCERIGHNPMSRSSVNCIGSLLLSIDAGLLRYDAKAARSCFDRRSASCNDDSQCTDVFLPTRTLGETCIGTLDCIDGACDRSTSCPGTCVPLSKEGETFGAVGGCETGLAWARLVDGGTRCQAKVAHGEPCMADDVVSESLCAEAHDRCYQRGDDAGLPRCEPTAYPGFPARGEPCNQLGCQDGLACREDGGCGDLFELNESCLSDFQGCVGNSSCQVSGRSAACAPLSGEGETCMLFFSCSAGLNCVDSKCTRARALGESCTSRDDCIYGYDCLHGTCSGPVCE